MRIFFSYDPSSTSPTMPKAAKRFATQRRRATSLSTNPETTRIRKFHQRQVGFNAEANRIKTKFRTRLTRAREALRASSQYTDSSADDHERMEAQCTKMHQEAKLQELESAGQAWLKIVRGNHVIQDESEVEEGNLNDETNADEMLEDVEWNGVHDDMQLDENDEDIEDSSCQGWETEEDDEEEEGESDPGSFEDGDVDVSDNEVLYDKDGNVMAEEDMGEGLKEIMERHMRRLRERLDMYAAIASLGDNDGSEEEVDGWEELDGEEEAQGEMK